MRKNGVRFLLMGGQACVFYGAAEFSRDLDLAVLLDDANLGRLSNALSELDASSIAVPPLSPDALERGHAVHFRCRRPDVSGLRIDVMSRLRGVSSFEQLWERRTTIETEGETIDLLSLPDLVLAKKTQRDKDWPMIRRLVEQAFYSTDEPSAQSVGFWLAELRSPELLLEVAERYPAVAAHSPRAAVQAALRQERAAVEEELEAEEKAERAADRLYWEPLREELGRLRLMRRNQR
jgi:ribosomal protein L12E/L44/L45/RPP1/RPP2